MELSEIEYTMIKPDPILSDVVESFWALINHSQEKQDVIVLPDGRVDIFFATSFSEPYHVVLLGLGSKAEQSSILPGTRIFAVSLKLLAVEYVLDHPVAALLNSATRLPQNFWGITPDDTNDFNTFCKKVSDKISSLLKDNIDERKRILFHLIYASQGAISVKTLSEQAFWSSRQINRYFNEHFGLSLKAYCNILRFRAAFPQIREGNFYTEDQFSDQAHFIKEVKRFSGVTPKELSKNKNGRFIQFSAWSKM